MFSRDSGDSTLVCPYDETHIILAKSFNSHLVKCRKNNTHHKKVPCRFDRTHMVPQPELQHHHTECASRHLLNRELQLISEGNGLKGEVSGPPIRSSLSENNDDDNCWDNDQCKPLSNHLHSLPSTAPKYIAKSALFYNPKHIVDDEIEANNLPHSSKDINQEDLIQRKPHGPSKAEQLTVKIAPRKVLPQVYQYALGRGRGTQLSQGVSGVKPLGQSVTLVRPHLNQLVAPASRQQGRGIVKYATCTSARVLTKAATPAQCNKSGDPCSVTDLSQFKDAERGTSGSLSAPVVGIAQDKFLASLDEEMKVLLEAEKAQSQKEMEELVAKQEERHLQLMEKIQQKTLGN